MVGDVRTFARNTARELNQALARMRVDPVKIDAEVDKDRVERSVRSGFVSAGQVAVRAFAGSLTGGLAILPSLIGPALITAGLGIAAGIAAVVGPALGGLIASAVLAAGGLGVIGLGAFLLREEPELVRAANRLMDSVKRVFRQAAQPLLEPLSDSLGIFERLVVRIGPQLRSMFADVAPAVEPFARGLAGLVESALPGLQELISAAEPFLRGLAAVLPDFGRDLSNFFGNIAASGPEATIFFQDFIGWIGAFIRNLGEFIGWLTRAYVAVKNFLGPLPDILREAWAAFRDGASAAEVFDILEQAFEPGFFDRVVETLRNMVTSGLNYLVENIPNVIDTFLAMKSAVMDAAVQLVLGIAQALPEIIPAVVNSLVQVVTTLVNGLVEAVPQVVMAAGELINGLVDGIVNALPTLIPAVVQIGTSLLTGLLGLIPIIIQAGLRLIQGLVEGLLSALPQVQMAMIQAIPQIIGALITALPQLLLAGIQIITAIVQGIGNALPQVAEVIQSQVIPMLLTTLQTQGPMLIQQGVQALQQFMQGWIDNVSLITDVITNQIIPTITQMFQENPEILEAGIQVLQTLLQAWADNIGLLTTFITEQFIPQITALLRDNPEIIDAAINIILVLIQAWADNIDLITTFITETLIPTMTQVIEENGPQLAAAGVQIMIALLQGLLSALPSIIGGLARVGAQMISTLIQLVPRMASTGAQLIASLAGSLLSAWGSRIGGIISTVKNGITGAFSGAANWLRDAGRRIIDGLISGIRAGFDRVRSTLGSLTSMLPDWKGPAEVDRRILRDSGRLVMQGFGLGIEDERRSIQRQLQTFTGDLATMALPTSPRGGDGASLGGTTYVTIEPGAIVIQGQGQEAGEEAAEAVLERLGQAALVR